MKAKEECLDYVKPFYKVDEAVCEWCGIDLTDYQKYKNELDSHRHSVLIDQFQYFDDNLGYGRFPLFPDIPCFKKRIEQLTYAIEVGDIPHQRDGRPIDEGDHVNRERRTIKPVDLKIWLEKHHPNERPAFLFNQMERKELLDRKKLLADNDNLRAKVDELESKLELGRDHYRKLKAKLNDKPTELSTKQYTSLYRLIKTMAEKGYGKSLNDRGFAKELSDDSQLVENASLSENTIRSILNKIFDEI